jgi:S-adenosyl methyltransferase
MTEQDEQRDRWQTLGIRTDIPHPARVYDYLLGGKDNFAVDRAAAEASLRIQPQVLDSARGNRKFLVRAVRFLRESGIRQFLDIGTGLPTSPNTHEVAAPDSRVVYVDNDPMVFLHAEALMADDKTTSVVRADMRDGDEVLAAARKHLDFSRPVALMFLASLHNIPDSDDPAGLVARYLAAVAPGSYLAISHVTGDFSPEQMKLMTEESARRGTTFIGRTKQEVEYLFNGLDLVDPGLVPIAYWRPDGGQPDANADRVWGYCGVAHT